MAGEWSSTGPCAGDIIHIVYFTFSMNFLSFGCTIFRGNQVIKKHFQAQHKAVEKDRTVGKRFSLSQNFYVHKTFTFSNMSHSQNQRSSLQYLQYFAVIHHYGLFLGYISITSPLIFRQYCFVLFN